MSLTTGRLATGTVRLKTGMVSSYALASTLESIPAGKITATIYSLIRDNQFQKVIKLLQDQPKSRQSLSLLGYCYYQIQDYANSCDAYEDLVKISDSDDYRLYYAQSLFKSGQYHAAQQVCHSIDSPKVVQLEASILYATGDYIGCKNILHSRAGDSPDVLSDSACLLFKEGKIQDALDLYLKASNLIGFRPDLAYNTCVCFYLLKDYKQALSRIGEIIENGIRNHPDLNVGMTREGVIKSVGNSLILQQSYLVEAFNLKAAIEYQLGDYREARESLDDMPPRDEHELDQVTLHNQGLMNMEKDPASGFEKLGFLIDQSSSPPETFENLVLLYIKYGFLDSAADLIAEGGNLVTSLTPYIFDFVDASLQCAAIPEEAFKKFDALGDKHVETLRALTKKVQEAKDIHNDEQLRMAIFDYENEVSRYIPVLMAQAKIFWDKEDYKMVEKIFRKSVEFCSDNETWKLNVAHVLFMQEGKYKEAISFYEPIVKKHYSGNILSVPAIVLANLCVSYIMVSQNEEAEEIMRRVEREEDLISRENPTQRIFHLCIVNLVIGTLYCSKGNFEFGISRIIKSMEPFSKKLGTDTWFYAKRCFAALYESLAKHTLILPDSVFNDILNFFDSCEQNGRNIPATVDPLSPNTISPSCGKLSVATEARLLKSMFLKIYRQNIW